MQEQGTQPRPPQRAESSRQTTSKAPRHVMPGLVPEIVQAFRTPRKYYTTRAVSDDEGTGVPVVNSCLFHDLFNRMEKIERKMAAREDAPSVRENLHLIRRSA